MKPLLLPAAFVGLLASAAVSGAGGHTHGVATLQASVDGDALDVALTIPLESLLGFERVPKYEKDLAKVREVAAELRRAEQIVAPGAAGGCVLSAVKLASEVIAPELLGEGGGNKAPAEKADHADLDATYRFKCAKPTELKSLEAKLFDRFKRIRVVEARLVTEKRQSAARLTAKTRTLSW